MSVSLLIWILSSRIFKKIKVVHFPLAFTSYTSSASALFPRTLLSLLLINIVSIQFLSLMILKAVNICWSAKKPETQWPSNNNQLFKMSLHELACLGIRNFIWYVIENMQKVTHEKRKVMLLLYCINDLYGVNICKLNVHRRGRYSPSIPTQKTFW